MNYLAVIVLNLGGGLACRRFRWRVSSLTDAGSDSFGLDLGRGAGIDFSTSETSETSSGSKSMGSSRWSPCAFPFPFTLPFVGFSWGTADLRWGCFERDGVGASSLSVTMIGSALPWGFSSDLA